jgi:hypothetical protein
MTLARLLVIGTVLLFIVDCRRAEAGTGDGLIGLEPDTCRALIAELPPGGSGKGLTAADGTDTVL